MCNEICFLSLITISVYIKSTLCQISNLHIFSSFTNVEDKYNKKLKLLELEHSSMGLNELLKTNKKRAFLCSNHDLLSTITTHKDNS